jgi:glycosyltransferase involved in cell wall biosynthesis
VYTVENGEYPYLDEGLSKHIPEGIEVIRRPIMEPYNFYRKLSGQKQKVNPTIFAGNKDAGLFKKLLFWIRGNMFIPDPRVFWVKPSVNFLTQYLKEHPVGVIVSTGPPQSLHLIARNLKRKLNIPWLADFRDPWTKIYFFNQMHMSAFAKKIHLNMERSVLKEADVVVTVSAHCKSGFQQTLNRKIEVITNGYEEFEIKETEKEDDKIRMISAGVLSQDRNPIQFWNVLNDFLSTRPDLKLKFELWMIGNVDPEILSTIEQAGLKSNLRVLPSIPHSELQKHLVSADILLLIGVPGHPEVITGKFFEYLYLKKPIYSISPADSDLVKILNDTQSGCNAGFEDDEMLRNNLQLVFEALENGEFKFANVEMYSRKSLTKDMAGLLDAILI